MIYYGILIVFLFILICILQWQLSVRGKVCGLIIPVLLFIVSIGVSHLVWSYGASYYAAGKGLPYNPFDFFTIDSLPLVALFNLPTAVFILIYLIARKISKRDK